MKLHPESHRIQVHVYLTINELDKVDICCRKAGKCRATFMKDASLKAVKNFLKEEANGKVLEV